jgi:ketosteroid isomerase-like protein
MSQENVEIVRTAIDAWNRDGDIDALVEVFATDSVIHPFPEWPGPKVYYGRKGMRKLAGEWIENFDEIRWDTDRLIDSADQVIALVNHRGRIKGTDIPIAQPLGAVFADFREDRSCGAAHFFMTWEEALEAAGMSE